MELLIANIRLFTNVPGEPIRDNQAVIIGDGQVKAMGPEKEMVKLCTGCRKIDGEGKLVMPGLINCHMHLYSTFARGIAINEAAHGFPEILKKLWWRLDSSLDEEAVYYSALVPAITAVKRGVTAMIDHHAGPNAVDGSLDRIEAALRQVGLRATLCYEVSDRDGKEIAQQGLRENERYIKKCKLLPNGLFHGMMGLHASFTVANDTLTEAAQIARNQDVGCHIHLAEDISDAELSIQRYRARPVKRLQEAGVLGPRTIAAHGIHLDPEEIDILNASQSMIVHNPQSNMNNA
ncbi:MAG: amidohydrolase family protein, partial [bacterium]|nr:amidohydrolase family protein [bacterium]